MKALLRSFTGRVYSMQMYIIYWIKIHMISTICLSYFLHKRPNILFNDLICIRIETNKNTTGFTGDSCDAFPSKNSISCGVHICLRLFWSFLSHSQRRDKTTGSTLVPTWYRLLALVNGVSQPFHTSWGGEDNGGRSWVKWLCLTVSLPWKCISLNMSKSY